MSVGGVLPQGSLHPGTSIKYHQLMKLDSWYDETSFNVRGDIGMTDQPVAKEAGRMRGAGKLIPRGTAR
jgi:hypothetical protein